MDDWKKWAIVAGGVVAVIGEFWTNSFYLSTIGGVVAVVVGLMLE